MMHRTSRFLLAILVPAGVTSLPAWGADPLPVNTPPAVQSPLDPSLSEPSPELMKEVRQRLRDNTIRELRSAYNGDYGVSLQIADDEVLCYVALYYRRELWRLFRYDALGPAERTYTELQRQTQIWSDDAIRRQVLASQRRELEKMLQANEERANALLVEMQNARAQRQRIADEQRAAMVEVQAAEAVGRDMRDKLEKLRTQIQKFESELAVIDNTGPAPTPVSASTASVPAASPALPAPKVPKTRGSK